MATKMPGRNGGTLRRLEKGESGNPKGRAKKLRPLDELLAEVLGTDGVGEDNAKKVLEAMMKSALKGNVAAQTALLNRAYGMPTQKTEVTGRDGSPLSGSFIVEVQQTTNGDSSDTSDGENKP